MKIQIKNRFTAAVIFECEAESMKIAVKLAIESRANLLGADLSRADLLRANLSRANLSWADLSRANLLGANLLGANLSRADLSWADLSLADLSGADLSGADLSRADLSGAKMFNAEITKPPLQIGCGFRWFTIITETHIHIGCQVHTAVEWFKFTDEQISNMHYDALVWWKEHRDIIKALYEKHSGKKITA